MRVRSLALFSGLRIQRGCELWCRSSIRLGFHIAVAVLQASSCSFNSPPSLGTSLCCECSFKLKKAKKKKLERKKGERKGGREGREEGRKEGGEEKEKKKERRYIHNRMLLSHKKNQITAFAATHMELETLIPSEVSQKETDKYHMISLISGI